MKNTKHILLTAYAVNPFKGSEDGTGWNISRELAKTNVVHIITRKNNQEEIDRYLKEHKDPIHNNMNFYYYDLPWLLMFWKKKLGERGYVLYFYLWQLFLPLFVKIKGIKFDLAHAVNFHSDSHPQFLWTLGKPVFWGPIGHHPLVPKNYLISVYGKKNYIKDRLYNFVKFMMRNFDPFYYISKWTAKRIFVINSGVNLAVKAKQSKIIILPAVANRVIKPTEIKHQQENFTVLAVGRFVYMKGFDVTIRAFSKFYHALSPEKRVNVKLKLVGKGEELERMKDIIREEKIEDVVDIIPWVEKEEMEHIYLTSTVFCFGSHEGAGMVIPEALSYGLPIVCFENFGPGELCDSTCAIKIPYSKYNQSIEEFAKALTTLFNTEEQRLIYSKAAIQYSQTHFHWESKADIINTAYSLVS
jgi:glycosyltransferase involved in cell wall biosynthesis